MRDIPMNPVDSSQISEIGHDPLSNTLAIRFKNWNGVRGSLYHYENFTAEDFAAFQAAESIGRHFGEHIKPNAAKHHYKKVES